MKKLFVLLFLAAAAALGFWYGWRGPGAAHYSSATVTNLLPKGTLALLYLPDFKRSRAQWHETDLYKLWSEPAVQDFLRKPLARSRESDDARRSMAEWDALEMHDAFLALTALTNERPSIVAGFRCKAGVAAAEKVVNPWRARLRETMPTAQQETIVYEGHKIEGLSQEALALATVYAGDWFFASNDLADLKALLDRLDKRATDQSMTLTADENFIAAARRMPGDYAVLGYARLDRYMQKLIEERPAEADDGNELSALRQVKSVAAAMLFQEGKMRDVLFVVMPKPEGNGELTRESIALATTESFLYFASVLHLSPQLDLAQKPGAMGSRWPALLGQLAAAGTASNITRADWLAAFGQELGVVGDWPANNRSPALFTTLAVKDAARAKQIVETLTTAVADGNDWTRTEEDGVEYFSQRSTNPMLPMAPTIGLSPERLVAGLDAASVQRAIKRGESPGGARLAASDTYKKAADSVPTAKQAFTYLDTALLYQRLDAALRPMLIMAGAFMPKVAETVDLGKLPAADIITRHLSPWVASQSYAGDGYLVEAVGPFSIFQVAMGGTLLSGGGADLLPRVMGPGKPPPPPAISPAQTPEPSAPEAEAGAASPSPVATP